MTRTLSDFRNCQEHCPIATESGQLVSSMVTTGEMPVLNYRAALLNKPASLIKLSHTIET